MFPKLKSLHFKRSKLNVLQVIFGSNKNEMVIVDKYQNEIASEEFFACLGISRGRRLL